MFSLEAPIVTESGVSKATQKPIKWPGWWKVNFALFRILATGGGGRVDAFPKADSLLPPPPLTISPQELL